MTTLHIELQITDLAGFKASFAQNAETRRQAGVRTASVRRPLDDDSHLVIDLDFETVPQAEAFLGFLRENIWKDQPILAGPPQATLLEPLDLSA